ncbi:hypothetical protein [Urechidicola vernalis]|uniref:Porin n=1 Tax=Urechidicola vernalis TaxID=3075600 RepID=A0ABU2Y4G5_9FLAO|nr:hypothetical protein [Urechidicola sp. P050]MDT0553083.1 hypothetical protein [Urechidicola sp. P050]
MKKALLFIGAILIGFTSYAQERYLTVRSNDSLHGQPKFKASLGANIKLNGYYDVFGGLQGNDTFNVGQIDVFGDDDSGSFGMDMYQSQLKFETTLMEKNGKEIYAIVEFDFWGGNGQMRLRKAYVEFANWQIGQGWASFGDEALWPNIMEWEGPPSGVWVRSPHIKYFNTIGGNPDWRFILALDAPQSDYNKYGEIEPLVDDAHQTTPDFIAGVKHEKEWGHIRFASMIRSINYKFNDVKDNFIGYGFSFSGMLKKDRNNFQYQFTGGKGITAYITSVAGFGYDGFPTSDGNFEATPSYGGWASYEHFWTPKIHTNFVLGYTRYYTNDIARLIYDGDTDDIALINGDIDNKHGYGIVNIMYDPFERMTFGLELDYGSKTLDVNGTLNGNEIIDDKTRDAMRISFGLMFYF